MARHALWCQHPDGCRHAPAHAGELCGWHCQCDRCGAWRERKLADVARAMRAARG